MENTTPDFDVIIIGGSYAGLSAGMALGRSLRNVLILDNGKPCNQQTPHSHNFITQDGAAPSDIASLARAQVLEYPTVKLMNGLATDVIRKDGGFVVKDQSNRHFTAKKLLFATGLSDEMPGIEGFAECWGISVLHCPYCHGYEVRGQAIGIIGNGDSGFDLCRLIYHWSKKLTLLTNGIPTLTPEQVQILKEKNISVDPREIRRINHTGGMLTDVQFTDGSKIHVTALYARPRFTQHCDIPQRIGCELTDHNFIKVNDFLQTTIPGTFAAGDNMSMLRSVASAVAAGNRAGAFINKELLDEEF